MKPITKAAWTKVHEKACDIANAAMADDVILIDVYTSNMFDLLDNLEREFGLHPEILATRADYLNDDNERKALYKFALDLARERGDKFEMHEIFESLSHLEEG